MAEFKKDRFYVTADAVVFSIIEGGLKILLIQRKNTPFKGKYAIPGGFVELDENLKDAAARELEEETGVKDIYLRKLTSVGHVGRDPRGRVITIPFMALISAEKIKLHAGTDAAMAKWYSAYSLPELAFDHKKILQKALEELRFEVEHSNIAFQIMPDKFTLTELQRAYEIILDKELDKRNFRKKLTELDLVREVPGMKRQGAHRPAKLYSFKSKDYKQLD